jgi:hypothetical protein
MLCNLTNLDESQIHIALSEIKKLHVNKKYEYIQTY